MSSLDEILQHHGIRGMKWGVRRFHPQSSSAPSASTDSTRAKEALSRVRKGGTKTLSTRELQDLVTRMNLEQQFARLKPPTKKQQAAKFVTDILVQIGKQQASKLAGDLAAEAIKKALKK